MSYYSSHVYVSYNFKAPTWKDIFQLGRIVYQTVVSLNNTLKHVLVKIHFLTVIVNIENRFESHGTINILKIV